MVTRALSTLAGGLTTLAVAVACGTGISDRIPGSIPEWVYVGGSFTISSGSQSWSNLARFYVDGTLDTSFPATNVIGEVHAIVAAPEGEGVIVMGDFTGIDLGGSGVVTVGAIAKISHSGELQDYATTAVTGGTPTIKTALLDGTSLYIGGSFVDIDGAGIQGLAKLNASTGVVDTAFVDDGEGITADTVHALAIHNGVLYVGGSFSALSYDHNGATSGHDRLNCIDSGNGTLLSDGHCNSNFTATGAIQSLATLGDYLYIGGVFGAGEGYVSSPTGLSRVEISGLPTEDASFTPASNSSIRAILPYKGTQYHVVGAFSSIGGQTVSGIALMNGSAAVTDFLGNAGTEGVTAGAAHTLARYGERLYVGGNITTYADRDGDQTARKFFVVDAATGDILSALGPDNGHVNAIAPAGP